MYKLILPRRYLVKRKISLLAITAVALCVFIVVVVMTVMNGLVGDFREKNHRFAGDCVISTDSLVGFPYYEDLVQRLEGSPFVMAVSPVVHSYGLLSQPGSEKNMGVQVTGLDPVRHSPSSAYAKDQGLALLPPQAKHQTEHRIAGALGSREA